MAEDRKSPLNITDNVFSISGVRNSLRVAEGPVLVRDWKNQDLDVTDRAV